MHVHDWIRSVFHLDAPTQVPAAQLYSALHLSGLSSPYVTVDPHPRARVAIPHTPPVSALAPGVFLKVDAAVRGRLLHRSKLAAEAGFGTDTIGTNPSDRRSDPVPPRDAAKRRAPAAFAATLTAAPYFRYVG
jgi:hypothetical protein